MDRNTGRRSCSEFAADFCGYVTDEFNRFITWLSVNVPLFFRRMCRCNWRPSFMKCFKRWKSEEDDMDNLKTSDVELSRVEEAFGDGSNLKHRKSPIRDSENPLAISVVRVETMSSDDAKEIERESSRKIVKAVKNPERKKLMVTINAEEGKEDKGDKKVDRVLTPEPIKAPEDTVINKLYELNKEHVQESLSINMDEQNEMKREDVNMNTLFQQTTLLDNNVSSGNTEVDVPELMETVNLGYNDDLRRSSMDSKDSKKEILDGKVSVHEIDEDNATVVDILTDNEKFMNNLKDNLRVLASLGEGVKLWINHDDQKLYIDTTYVQSVTRKYSNQGKSVTLEFIKRMIDTAKLAAIEDNEYNDLLEDSKVGVKNIKNTYNNQSWYGKYDEVIELEGIIKDMGWKSDSDQDSPISANSNNALKED